MKTITIDILSQLYKGISDFKDQLKGLGAISLAAVQTPYFSDIFHLYELIPKFDIVVNSEKTEIPKTKSPYISSLESRELLTKINNVYQVLGILGFIKNVDIDNDSLKEWQNEQVRYENNKVIVFCVNGL